MEMSCELLTHGRRTPEGKATSTPPPSLPISEDVEWSPELFVCSEWNHDSSIVYSFRLGTVPTTPLQHRGQMVWERGTQILETSRIVSKF